MTCFMNRTYRSCDFGRTTKYTTIIRLRYNNVSENSHPGLEKVGMGTLIVGAGVGW